MKTIFRIVLTNKADRMQETKDFSDYQEAKTAFFATDCKNYNATLWRLELDSDGGIACDSRLNTL